MPLSSIHTPIPPVLHSVVASIPQPSGDLCPTFSHILNELLNHLALVWGDRLMIETWFEILMIPFAALLW